MQTEVGAIGRDSLARTAQALQAIKAMQESARKAALNGPANLGFNPNQPGIQLPDVPNGLTSGGLQVAPKAPVNLANPTANEDPTLWQGASLPTQAVVAGRTNVSIIQNKQQALLNWQTFNVGKETSVTFDQTAGGENASQWIAFNKINDPSGVPSQILGSIDALGQVYLMNQNGIIFGGSSQINLHTLVASSLPINDNLVNRGLLNNPDQQFLFSSLAIAALPNGALPAFSPPPAPATPNGKIGAVTVQPGANLTSPTTPDHVGGRIALIGPDVTNGGTISTPDGQTILAAGQQVALTAHPSTDPSLRGLDVFVGRVEVDRGVVSNTGLIDAPRASVTLAGQTVDQLGVINSSTSVSLNGRIDLLANFNAVQVVDSSRNVSLNPSASGLITLGTNSVTQVVPELESIERVVGTQLALPSQINLQGLALHFSNDAQLVAPSAIVNLNAGSWLATTFGFKFVIDRGQVYLDSGALIDVAGSAGVAASVSENIIEAQLRGAELANFPLQRDGPLRGQTVFVDIRLGTPLADISGYVNLVQRTVGELTTAGGTVAINAGGSVVLQPGSSVDVSGGWIDYQGAFVQTTKVISGSNIFDISQATPDRVYTGIYNGSTTFHPKWGITETNSSGIINGAQFEPGYRQGANGGTLSITAPSMALDGTLLGATVSGPRQRTTPPVGSSLALAFRAQLSTDPFLPISPTPPNIIFQSSSALAPADPFAVDPSGNPRPLRADRLASVILAPGLLSARGFGNLKIENSDGNISVPANISLTSSSGGSIAFAGANISLDGSVVAPGGTLLFNALDVSPFVLAALDPTAEIRPDFTRGTLSLGGDAVLSTAGLITDQRLPADAVQLRPITPNGGAISLAGFNLKLAPESVVDVSGGVTVSANGAVSYGTGGTITLRGGQDPSASSVLGGNLSLGGELRGYSGARGGSLNILAPLIRIGGAPLATALPLSPDFFTNGGFNSFAITGIGAATSTPGEYLPAIVIGPNIVLAPRAESFLVNLDQAGVVALDRTSLPIGVRSPVNLSFNAIGADARAGTTGGMRLVRGDFLMSDTASILTDPGASVSIRGDTAAVLGAIFAPGGNISISGSGNSTGVFPEALKPLPTVDLGPRSRFDVAGTTVLVPNSLGYRTGSVLAGGNITVTGNIVAERGSLLDVSGATGVLDLAPGFSGANSSNNANAAPVIPTTVESNAGTITFNGRQELFLDSTLIGRPGGASANGGSLIVNSDRFVPVGSNDPLTPLTTTLFISQRGATIPQAFYGAGENAISHFVTGTNARGGGHLAADNLMGDGIESITLRGASGIGATEFDGDVSLTTSRQISLASAAIFADANVRLSAPYLKLGTDFQAPIPFQQIANTFAVDGQPFYFAPKFGAGTFTASGRLIDLGNLSMQGIGSSNFIAENGDIRGDGTLNAAGAINLSAGQIYPTTEVRFTIAADDYSASGFTLPGLITINQSGTRQTPLSAGGQLDIFASVVRQTGTLRAPIGTINLGNTSSSAGLNPISNQPFASTRQLTLGSGSVTSVSADGLTIPYGTNQNGTAWIDPAGMDITVSGLPGKSINLAAANLADLAGSTIDIRGGGDLFSYRFVSGNGGTRDILASNSSFAIVPGYEADFAPVDPGFANSSLSIGDRIFLNASDALPAGFYTLLPARYALLTGAVLVTPSNGVPTDAAQLADGASVVAGYRFNDLNAARIGQPLNSLFQIAPAAVVKARAEYDLFSANTFLREAALTHDAVLPRLPIDSGRLVLTATQTMSIQGAVQSQAPTGGRGGLVDLSSPADILIGRAGATVPNGALFLDGAALSAFGAESLLIGGLRTDTADGTLVTVSTRNLTVDNSGSSLTSPELILVAKENLTLAPNASLAQNGALAGPADTLVFGDKNIAGSGDGLLVRLTSDPAAEILRAGVDASTVPEMIIGAGARLVGASVTLDSTYATRLDPSANLAAAAIALNSGRISLLLGSASRGNATAGLVLSSATLQNFQDGLQSLSLLSYSSLDIFGAGQIGTTGVASLALHTGEIRGFDNDGGVVNFTAQNILLDNSPNRSASAAFGGGLGTLQFNAATIQLGANQTHVDQFSNVNLNAANGVVAQASGRLTAAGNLSLHTPLLTGIAAADETLRASGALVLDAPPATAPISIASGLGARLTLEGARVLQNSSIVLPSGSLTMHATLGDVSLGGTVDVSGQAQSFFDLVKYTSGGEVSLISDQGNIALLAGGRIDVGAQSGGGDAGTLTIRTLNGGLVAAGTLRGAAGTDGRNGSFALEVGQLGSLASLNQTLNAASFTEARTFRVHTGDVLVDGLATAHLFDLSVDAGSIQLTGVIDSSGAEGGRIALRASGSVSLTSGSQLSVAAQNFDAAGKGGSISLEAGSQINGQVDAAAKLNLATGAILDLSVAANSSTSQSLGQFTGVLHLRAPQTLAGSDLQVAPLNSTIIGASSVVLEGYHLFDLTGTDGSLTSAVQTAVRNNGDTFGGADAAMRSRLFANNIGLSAKTVIVPGAEIINRTGDLSLGSATSDPSSDWDLSTFRFGPNSAPGVLTLRASGNIAFYNALSDGFTSSAYDAQLLAQNSALPANVQSWSYRITSGADLSAADFHRVLLLGSLAANAGSVQLGKDYGTNVFIPQGSGVNAIDFAVRDHYQVIRTGTGDIDIASGRDVQLLNQLATIFTAGTRVTDPTMGGTFDLPIPDPTGQQVALLGPTQQERPGYQPQYSYAGGNISITVQNDLIHLTRTSDGTLVADSVRELPNNWLYRRGYVDAATGQFGVVARPNHNDVGSTTWWIDFSNFFEGIGTLGGGNIELSAGRNISNIDAVAPTNARMPKGVPNESNLVELGGGNVSVRAGYDLDAGVYYVERGHGMLTAGGSIHTNSTRSPSLGNIATTPEIFAPASWLPTTLFAGKAVFDVSARGDLELGPTASPFLLPQGINNTFWYKTYFNSYADESAVHVSSLTGDLTLRESATLPSANASTPLLQAWFEHVLLFSAQGLNPSLAQPWLRLAENQLSSFSTLTTVSAPTLLATAFEGDLKLVGGITLFPSPIGTVDLAAHGAIQGVQVNGAVEVNRQSLVAFGESLINLSDADRAQIPGIASPLAFRSSLTTGPNVPLPNQTANPAFFNSINNSFTETGSTLGSAGVLQRQQALHAAGLLHLNDPLPLHLYASGGDISGLTLFAGKPVRVVAARDLTDVAFFVQNNRADDISLVAAGRDLIAYNPNSALRVAAREPGNVLNANAEPASGDLQINGPGTLEVLAGRNFDLGVGPSQTQRVALTFPDDIALGIRSIGNARNPFLPFEGADVIAGAGIGLASGLEKSTVGFDDFVSTFLNPASGGEIAARYLPPLGKLLGLADASNAQVWDVFQELPAERQDSLALDIFYLVLRDAGRDRNNPDSAGFGNYDAANRAVAALFPGDKWRGDISLTSREIKTANGGNISLFAPGGQLVVGFDVAGTQAIDQGILTEHGGDISIYTKASVVVGTSRIFTLRGGNEIIFAETGDIAAGASSKTVQSAPPTRVLIDPQSGDVRTDLAGLATGGGIGVLNTVAGLPASDVDLIAPAGTVDAGDAGIRVSGNLNIAAVQVLNAGNIQTGGASVGTPVVAAPNLGNLTAASNAVGAQQAATNETGPRSNTQPEALPSIITVEVLGYGGGDGDPDNTQDEEEKKRRRQQQEQAPQGRQRIAEPVLVSTNS